MLKISKPYENSPNSKFIQNMSFELSLIPFLYQFSLQCTTAVDPAIRQRELSVQIMMSMCKYLAVEMNNRWDASTKSGPNKSLLKES